MLVCCITFCIKYTPSEHFCEFPPKTQSAKNICLLYKIGININTLNTQTNRQQRGKKEQREEAKQQDSWMQEKHGSEEEGKKKTYGQMKIDTVRQVCICTTRKSFYYVYEM